MLQLPVILLVLLTCFERFIEGVMQRQLMSVFHKNPKLTLILIDIN